MSELRSGGAGVPRYWRPEQALRTEARLLEHVVSGARSYACEVWITDQCLIAPAGMDQKPGFRRAAEELRSAGWPVFVRNTGGDVTPQGPGALNISIVFALPDGISPTIEGGFDVLCAPIFKALAALGHEGCYASVAGSFCDGAYNVVVGDRKIAGTAQRWRRLRSTPDRHAVFAHAVLLFDADLSAGVRAVNRLRRACGRTDQVRLNAHQNWAALQMDRHSAYSLNILAGRLSDQYANDLERLTCSVRAPQIGRFPPHENVRENYV